MDIVTYLKQLTTSERAALAVSIGSSPKYMQKLSTGAGSASIGLFAAIRLSEFNNKLPMALRLRKRDEVSYRKAKVAARV